MKTLRLSSFGMRGVVGGSLTPVAAMDFANAFGNYLDGGRILVGYDTRTSSPMLYSAVVSSLISAGCEVINFGVCPTPVLQFCTRLYKAAGAISISGGHNGMGWNSVSLIDSEGALLEPVGGEAVLDLYHAGGFERCDWAHLGTLVEEQDYFTRYLEALEKHINLEAIRSADFTVIIDPVGGSGCPFIEAFARRLNLTLVPVNAQQSGYLPRDPEPRPRSALQMASIIPYVKANAGFVLSSDMSRMSLVTEDGEPASEEYTLAVIVDHVMQKTPGTIVTNCCTSRTIDDIAVRHRIPLIKTRVGQAFVFSALADEQGLLGGEGSGSAGLPAFSNAFDGFLMMALILEAMAVSEEPLSSLLKRLPRYHILKLSRDCDAGAAYHAIERLQEGFKERGEVRMDLTDGIRFDWSDSWVHARLSRTEKTLRIIAEAPSRKKAKALARDVIRIVEQEL